MDGHLNPGYLWNGSAI